jgi:hypothetical protein
MPAWSMGKSVRGTINVVTSEDGPKSKLDVPGPGQYPLSGIKRVRDSSPSWGMGTSTRQQLGRTSKIPGPGTYVPTLKVR